MNNKILKFMQRWKEHEMVGEFSRVIEDESGTFFTLVEGSVRDLNEYIFTTSALGMLMNNSVNPSPSMSAASTPATRSGP